MKTVFDTTKKAKYPSLFFENGLSIARFDEQNFEIFEKLTKRQLGYFWKPDEVDVSKDIKDFRALNDAEQHIFTSNIKRQVMLDSIQGRSPVLALLPVCSSTELENWIITWSFFETIHSRSYSYIIQNIYPDPSLVLNDIESNNPIQECAKDISEYYDNFLRVCDIGNLEAKRGALILLLYAIAALEGVRFYISFACSWAFTEQRRVMEGNAKLIKLIARDENLHLGAVQHMVKILQTDKSYNKAFEATRNEGVKIFEFVAEQEKTWAEYLFQHGAMIGLNTDMLKDYVDWLVSKRLLSLGLPSSYVGTNPLPWTNKWISGKEVQNAPQEVVLTSYITGDIKQDVDEKTFSGFSL